jgi:hypothetical protein
MKQGIHRLQAAVQIGHQVGGKEEPEPLLREKTERRRVGIQKLRLEAGPVRLSLEGTHLLERFTPLETALEVWIPGVFVLPERVADQPYDGFCAFHPLQVLESNPPNGSRKPSKAMRRA